MESSPYFDPNDKDSHTVPRLVISIESYHMYKALKMRVKALLDEDRKSKESTI